MILGGEATALKDRNAHRLEVAAIGALELYQQALFTAWHQQVLAACAFERNVARHARGFDRRRTLEPLDDLSIKRGQVRPRRVALSRQIHRHGDDTSALDADVH